MNVETDDPDRHRILVSTNRHGRVSVCQYVSPTPGEPADKPTRILLTRDEALRLADALVDRIEFYELKRPAASLQLAIVLDERGPTRRKRRRKLKGETMTHTPTAVILEGPDGTVTTHPLVAGSWSGSGYRAALELDGQRILIHADVART
ncbi:hypothetical protein BOH72_14060 [Mycobacterium sp. WY10]|nr:hypothetical protein BOH72_14060 [Mycobacterium sp. WY10]